MSYSEIHAILYRNELNISKRRSNTLSIKFFSHLYHAHWVFQLIIESSLPQDFLYSFSYLKLIFCVHFFLSVDSVAFFSLSIRLLFSISAVDSFPYKLALIQATTPFHLLTSINWMLGSAKRKQSQIFSKIYLKLNEIYMWWNHRIWSAFEWGVYRNWSIAVTFVWHLVRFVWYIFLYSTAHCFFCSPLVLNFFGFSGSV